MKRLLTITSLFLSIGYLSAQSPSMIYYKGLGRSLADIDHMDEKSNFMKNDTTSDRRDLNGLFLFDLGVNVEPNEQLHAKCIMRLSNPFGAFYSFGSLFQFRQVSIEGILAKKFYYKIGDMDHKLTPFTLYNNADSWYEFESKLFADRRAIMQYENFNNGNNWRLQGIYAKTGWSFKKAIDTLNFSAFTVRNRKADLLANPERLYSGAELTMIGKKYLDLGVRAVDHYDVIGTAKDTATEYSNTVVSFNGAFKLSNAKFDLRFAGEGGFSNYSKSNNVKKISNKTSDNFFELNLTGKAKKSGLYASAVYRHVGAEFTSAGAQTRRLNDFTNGGMFVTGQNGKLVRPQALNDRLQYTALYNYTLTDGFSQYYIPYNIVNPYGAATPNRAGAIWTIGVQRPDSLVDGKVFVSTQSELVAIGVDSGSTNKRNFVEYGAGLNLNVNKLLKWKKAVVLNAGYKHSAVNRGGSNKIDLQANYIDLGLQVEVVTQIDLMVAYKAFSAKGNELVSRRDNLNRYVTANINDFQTYDLNETTLAAGAKYRLSTLSYISLMYSLPTFKNKLNDNYNYNYNQLFVNFTIGF